MGGKDRLSATLRQLRKDAGLSGTEAASRAGLSQSKVSRVENGVFMPTTEQVEALCHVYGAPAKVRRDLVRITKDLRAEASSARVVLQRGAWRMQQRIGRIEEASARVRGFHPGMIIGLLQTADYIRGVFGDAVPDDDRERVVEARLARQHVLRTDREFILVLTEGALRWHVSEPAVMVEQLMHVGDVSQLPNVRLGVIPWTTPARTAPLHGFHIYDSRAVVIGTETATAIVTDSRDVADYEGFFADYEELATFDDGARAVIARITQDFRGLR